ncbi:hypothetical protein DCAR_0625802 [Daucus carota subsp. sativus]|uniref:Uncharacterized protein n=1 Tax=Daucus carota subsp. sativus TaxID=79200 RepID=A0A161WU14_DAUCS|nr:PREDICTED: protein STRICTOSIDINE SYNTHASE-LIKE 10-like [Daucus carota subsp. sativus]WOH06376.1 hypothetical protein DCAR_0625802 [Daucus carota subsp. sativus]
MKLNVVLAALNLVYLSCILASGFLCDQVASVKEAKLNGVQKHKFEVIPIVGAVGPESFAFHPITGEGPYTGVSDGRIIKWNQQQRRWTNFAVTSSKREGCQGPQDYETTEDVCGRPLGLGFNRRTGDLYIADAYRGLYVVGPKGGLATLVTADAEGVPFTFLNGLDVDHRTGDVYFTDSSSVYQRRDFALVIITEDSTGRLLKYSPKTKKTTVILKNLTYPNGIAMSRNRDFLLFAETTKTRILKLWLQPSAKAGKVEVFAKLPSYPDNIKMNHKGELWAALYSTTPDSWITNYKASMNFGKTKVLAEDGSGMAVKVSDNGTITEVLEDKDGKVWKLASEVEERNGCLWIGSVVMPYAVLKTT